MASNALSAPLCSVGARRYAPVCNAADIVTTSTAATQTSDEDVNNSGATPILAAADCRFSASVVSRAAATLNPIQPLYSRSADSAHRFDTIASSPQSAASDHSSSHYHHHRSRMTATDSCSRSEDEEHYGSSKKDTKTRGPSVTRLCDSPPPSADSMNLRHRPRKAATADLNGNIAVITSSQISSSSADNSKHARRPAGRRRSHPFSSPSVSQSSTGQRPSIRNYFPLQTIGSVCELFRSQICPQSVAHFAVEPHDPCELYPSGQASHIEPNLALLSIVVGLIESSLTSGTCPPEDDGMLLGLQTEDVINKNALYPPGPLMGNGNNRNGPGGYSPAEGTPAPIVGSSNANSPLDLSIPTVHYDAVESLLNKFATQLKESVDLSQYPKKASRELIKKISEVVWSNLHRSYYKDRAHLQTLYSYLSENRLDCYGVAYTVVAACQILGFDDVRLVMSEDHAWVVFGEGETCEVTWHGKGNDDKLGDPVPTNTDSWLYLNGNTMVCDRFVTVATLVSAMNPSINATQDSEELAILQQQLLWILYDYGHLARYPMALGNLGDLEDICTPSIPRKEPIQLFHEAIESARKHYGDSHVYPYTYLGGYYFRLGRFKDALRCWADAAQVMRKYNYSRDDEEIYKEFQEIANDLIPNIVKYVSNKLVEPSNLPYRVPLLQDSECFAYLLRFYDGLCAWEEGSSTPVLHIGWTKPLVATISKFPHSIRSQVAIKVDYCDESDGDSDVEDDVSEEGSKHLASTIGERRRRRAASVTSSIPDETIGENGHVRLANGKKTVKQEKNGECKEYSPVISPSADFSKLSQSEADSKGGWRKAQSPSHRSKRSAGSLDDVVNSVVNQINDADLDSEDEAKTAQAVLISKKFAGLRNLLTADKLNTSAIQLQLTAQSQVNVNKRSRSGATKSGLGSNAGSELDFVSTTTTTLMRTSSTNNKRVRRD